MDDNCFLCSHTPKTETFSGYDEVDGVGGWSKAARAGDGGGGGPMVHMRMRN